jgi:hypothetical protein
MLNVFIIIIAVSFALLLSVHTHRAESARQQQVSQVTAELRISSVDSRFMAHFWHLEFRVGILHFSKICGKRKGHPRTAHEGPEGK